MNEPMGKASYWKCASVESQLFAVISLPRAPRPSDGDSEVPINLLACKFPTFNSLRRHFREAVHTAYSFCPPPQSSVTPITRPAVMHLQRSAPLGAGWELGTLRATLSAPLWQRTRSQSPSSKRNTSQKVHVNARCADNCSIRAAASFVSRLTGIRPAAHFKGCYPVATCIRRTCVIYAGNCAALSR